MAEFAYELCHCRIWADGELHDQPPTSPLLTPDQVARLLAAMPVGQPWLFALVLWRAALRQAEALKLEVGPELCGRVAHHHGEGRQGGPFPRGAGPS